MIGTHLSGVAVWCIVASYFWGAGKEFVGVGLGFRRFLDGM